MRTIKEYNGMTFFDMYNFLNWCSYIDFNFKWFIEDKKNLYIRSKNILYKIEFTSNLNEPAKNGKYKIFVHEVPDAERR